MAFNARLKARPEAPLRHLTSASATTRVDKAGRVTLRYLSRLHHIGIGSALHRRSASRCSSPDAHIRVVDEDGRLIRELTLDPTRDYQPLGTPCGRPKIGHYVPRQVGTIT